MRKAILLISLLCAFHSIRSQTTDGVVLCYGEAMDAGYGNENTIITPYVNFPKRMMGAFDGCQITSVDIGLLKEAQNVTVYIKNSPKATQTLYSQKVGALQPGWNHVSLNTPFDLTGDSIAIGYKATFAAGCDGGAAYCLNEEGMEGDVFVNSQSKWNTVGGTFCIQAKVCGDRLPDNQLMLTMMPMPDYTYESQPRLRGVVRNMGANDVHGYEIAYGVNDASAPYVAGFNDRAVLFNSSDTFDISPVLQMGDNQLTIRVKSVGGAEDGYAADNDATVLLPLRDIAFIRRVVMEEGTGNWCQFCVQGIEEIRYMKEHYPDEFVAICIHSGDKMEVKDEVHGYHPLIDNMPGFPYCFIDRRDGCSPYQNVRRYFKSIQKEPGHLGLEGQAFFNADSTTIAVAASVISDATLPAPAFKWEAVLLEDSIPGLQCNAFADGASGWFYGWETLPRYAPVNFDDVPRGIYPSFEGMPFLEGEELEAMKTYTAQYAFPVPLNTIDKRRLHVVLLLLHEDGTMANACNVYPVGETVGMESHMARSAAISTMVYDLQGRLLRSAYGREVSLEGLSGVVIVKTCKGGQVKTIKRIL